MSTNHLTNPRARMLADHLESRRADLGVYRKGRTYKTVAGEASEAPGFVVTKSNVSGHLRQLGIPIARRPAPQAGGDVHDLWGAVRKLALDMASVRTELAAIAAHPSLSVPPLFQGRIDMISGTAPAPPPTDVVPPDGGPSTDGAS